MTLPVGGLWQLRLCAPCVSPGPEHCVLITLTHQARSSRLLLNIWNNTISKCCFNNHWINAFEFDCNGPPIHFILYPLLYSLLSVNLDVTHVTNQVSSVSDLCRSHAFICELHKTTSAACCGADNVLYFVQSLLSSQPRFGLVNCALSEDGHTQGDVWVNQIH